MKNFRLNFGTIALRGVVGSERNFRGFGILPNKQNAVPFTERVPFSYACYGAFTVLFCDKDIGKERNGKTIAATNKQFYVVRGVTQFKTAFVGKAINSLPFEN